MHRRKFLTAFGGVVAAVASVIRCKPTVAKPVADGLVVSPGNDECRDRVLDRCSRDFAYFCNNYLWTYSPKDHPESPHQRFVLYPFQEECASKLIGAIGKHDLLIRQSREMGVTWLLTAVSLWLWRFHDNQSLLWCGRTEGRIDTAGDLKSEFGKWDYMLEWLPGWMQPKYDRTYLHARNHDSGSTFDGESATDSFGCGNRQTSIFIDGLPTIQNGASLMARATDATRSCIFTGVPGEGGLFDELCATMTKKHPERVITLPWWMHPVKAKGLYVRDGQKRSPWYDERALRAISMQDIDI